MKIIILAGGRATRLPESAKDTPNPLVAVRGKPVLQHEIEHLHQHGLTDIRISLGWMADHVIDFLKKISKC